MLFDAFAVLSVQTPISLDLNTPVRATVGAWAPRVYQINLKAGQYLEAVVEEKGIAIQVRLIDPAGKKLREIVGGSARLRLKKLSFFDPA